MFLETYSGCGYMIDNRSNKATIVINMDDYDKSLFPLSFHIFLSAEITFLVFIFLIGFFRGVTKLCLLCLPFHCTMVNFKGFLILSDKIKKVFSDASFQTS